LNAGEALIEMAARDGVAARRRRHAVAPDAGQHEWIIDKLLAFRRV
jgi:hypothetical protein